ncbi:ABC-2 type transporter-domain-containing protein [Aspergillus pseudoustus]|uniref:ABC-2 type transporter-domain-containing protein n=1 Tax=Aspergillus pseudoustus TaxID=1810923 RepID=A0ABR4J9A2_9EURO
MDSQPESKDPPREGHGNVLNRALTRLSSIARTSTIPNNEESISNDLDWEEMPEVQALQQAFGESTPLHRKLGLTWTNLTVLGRGADSSFHENVVSQFLPARLKGGNSTPTQKTILSNSHGCVKPGEMLLVLGRPGSGCSTLLNVLGNRRDGYTQIKGQVNYGSMDHEEALEYRGQIITNSEDEIFFPTLTAAQTMDFATRMKVPHRVPSGYKSREDARIATRDFLFHLLSISHTANTRVGNEFIRGVSGGERKRLSIIEAMATRGSIYCWDNPTKGLDANTALQYVKAIRKMTDLFGLASIVTLYQAGNGIYELFDKVLVLDQGKQIYYGPMKEARPFMEQLGFICADGANVADFMAGVTVPTERKIRDGYEATFPRTTDEILTRYNASDIHQRMQTEYNYPDTEEAKNNTQEFKLTIREEKHPGLLTKGSPVTVGFHTQLITSIQRQYQILRGDKAVLFIKQGTNLIQALSSGSLFYNAPNTSTGIFLKSGAIFVALLFNCLVAQSEVTDSFFGRPVLAKHRKFALHHPAAWCLAQIITDIPIILFQVSVFSVVIYFLVGLKSSAEAFFTFWFIILSATMCLTAFFRAVGAGFKTFDDASKFSGVSVTALLLYIGYMITKHEMHPWFVWIFWIDPLAYAYDALVSNELHNTNIPCVGPNLVPNGPGYGSPANQACTGVRGALPGATVVNGDQYLESLTYSHSHVWRNVGIVWAWWALYVVLTIIGTSFWKDTSSQKGPLTVPRELARKPGMPGDQEAQAQINGAMPGLHHSSRSLSSGSEKPLDGSLIQNKSIFTWRNLTYTVDTADGPRVLLDNVHGWVKPGMLGALMGASGAGKTTLQDVLAQRKTEGTIKGSVLVDGRPLPINFQRSAGYCEQLDVHEPLTTVREALEFSALLRQPQWTPQAEKLAYVDTIIDLLEMHDISDSLVGYSGGDGLSVEDRKRLTIGVELVAKPSVLIFLDEPTSGLDGQAAFNIVRFLKKLATAGQAILVTIHQPSAQLFYEFDTVLLLARGGKTVYFGDIGHQASTLKSYFRRYNADCPPDKNPAEHMIDVVSDRHKDWHKIWLESPQHEAMLVELDRMIDQAASKPAHINNDDGEFAMPLWDQTVIVTRRLVKAMYRNVGYVNNKFALHIIMGLFTGFSYWQLGSSVSELQMRMFALFNFIFVAPGVIAQLQPLFIEKRNIYDAREKKSRMYSWKAFVTGLIISELPYLVICAVLFFFCFYYTVGFPADSDKAGAVFFIMLMYEFLYTGIGQFIAAYAPNATAAVLINPLIIFTLVGFCGVLVPYSQITAFWRYWLYWINPFNYLVGSLLVFTTFDLQVQCRDSELAVFSPPDNQTCGQYLAAYEQNPLGSGSNLLNPEATADCRVCQYKAGSDFLRTVNLNEYYYGWRDAAIVVIYVISSYALVYLFMKLRTKKSKKVEH